MVDGAKKVGVKSPIKTRVLEKSGKKFGKGVDKGGGVGVNCTPLD